MWCESSTPTEGPCGGVVTPPVNLCASSFDQHSVLPVLPPYREHFLCNTPVEISEQMAETVPSFGVFFCGRPKHPMLFRDRNLYRFPRAYPCCKDIVLCLFCLVIVDICHVYESNGRRSTTIHRTRVKAGCRLNIPVFLQAEGCVLWPPRSSFPQ